MSLAISAMRSAAWMTLSGAGTTAIGLVGTMVLIRFLSPLEYGEATAAAVVVGTASQLSTFGVGQFVIVRGAGRRDLTFHATAVHVLLGALALAIVYVLREPLGVSFNAPMLGRFIPGLVLAGLCDRVSLMPERILMRDMHFRAVAVARALGELSYTAASLAFGIAGMGGMAIVLGNVARSLVRGVILIAVVERAEWVTFSRLKLEHVRELFRFGLPLWLANVSGYASRRWDNLLVARFFGPGLMGAYNLAYNLAEAPATIAGDQLIDVLLPSFARLKPSQRPAAFLRATALVALIASPLAVGLSVVAPTAVKTFLDPKWAGVAPMLIILSALSLIRPPSWLSGSYLQAAERPGLSMWLQLFEVGAVLGGVALLGPLGSSWVCVGVVLGALLRTLVGAWVIHRTDGMSFGGFLLALLRPVLACAPMVGAVLGVRRLLATDTWPKGLGLAVEVVAGGLAYLPSAFVLAGAAARDFLGLARRALDRRRHPVDPMQASA